MAQLTKRTKFSDNKLTKAKLLTVFKNDSAIARATRLTTAYVCRWKLHEEIPEIAEMRLRFWDAKDIDWDKIADLHVKK